MRRLLLPLVIVMVGSVTPVGAATECLDGPAAASSVDRPHVVDPADDLLHQGAFQPLRQKAHDLRTFWVGVEPGRPAADPRFTANFSVDLDPHPVGLMLSLRAADLPYSWARALPDGTWAFEYGNLIASSPGPFFYEFQPRGTTTGVVDAATGTLTINLHPSTHPGFIPNVEVAIDDYTVTTGYGIGPSQVAGSPVQVPVTWIPSDTSSDGAECRIVLYEVEEESSTQP